ncbi:MAG: glycoside hydrolase family 92 protein [Ferruginibacter sp.]|nr:glycoside hydrolase family 92 protein [Ferruginibacter sp.]
MIKINNKRSTEMEILKLSSPIGINNFLCYCRCMFIALIFLVINGHLIQAQTKKLHVDYVDNFIGVRDNNSNCVIGPQLPFGSINPSPQTQRGQDDGYHPKEPIRGFGQLHVSATGWGTNGQIFLSPQTGLAVGDKEHDSPKSNEKATPYEYQVTLNRYNIATRVSPSYHSAIYQFTFPKSDSSNLLLDITHNIPMDIKTIIGGEVSGGKVTIDGSYVTGNAVYRGGFGGGNYSVYFVAEVSKKPIQKGTWLNGAISIGSASQGLLKKNDRVGAILNFSTKANEIIYLKIAVSYKSIEQAKAWLDAEIPGFDYRTVKETAKSIWNNTLSKIDISVGTETEKTIFYSALYHAHLMPRDRTNDSQNFGKDVPVWDDHFAVWDTWRTVYPLHVLINPGMVSGTINSFIARSKKFGFVKDAFVNGNDMGVEQGGNNIDNIIADAYVKGIQGVDWNEAYKLMRSQAETERKGIGYGRPDSSKMYKELGWIPAGKMSCSVTLEYAYNDFCAAQMAKKLGTESDYKKYLDRSGKWENLWNPEAESDGFKGFIVPKRLGSGFVPIDIKKEWGSWRDYFYEGSSWTYSYFIPHQFEKLVQLSGGKKMFAKKLAYAFENKLIDYGNEPAFLAVQAFHYADRSDLASYYVRKLMRDRYSLDGYMQNDDSGAMSSWYIFSAMGFFPNAGQNIYYLTGAAFSSVSMKLANGKNLRITAKNASDKNIYIQSCRINGRQWNKSWFIHQDIENGGTIEFVMGNKPVQIKNQYY